MFYRLVCWGPNGDSKEADVETWMETSQLEVCVAFGSTYADLDCAEIVMLDVVGTDEEKIEAQTAISQLFSE